MRPEREPPELLVVERDEVRPERPEREELPPRLDARGALYDRDMVVWLLLWLLL